MEQGSARRSTLVDLVIEVPAVAVTFVMMLHVTANAVLRTVANDPIPYTLETTQYVYMPVVAFLGFMAAQRRGQHIAADLVYEMLSEAGKRVVLSALLAVTAVLMAGLAWYGWGEAMEAFEIRKHAGISPLPAWPAYFLAPLAFAVLTLQFIAATLRAARGEQVRSLEDEELAALDADPVASGGVER